MTTLATLVVKLVADAQSYSKDLDDAGKKTSGFLDAIGKHTQTIGQLALGAGAALAAGLGAAVVKLGPQAIAAASDFQESLSKVNVVFGASAGAVTEFAGTAASQLGLTENAALAAAGTFGNLFTTMGVGQGPAAQMSTDLLTLAADLASFNNLDPTEVLDKLRSGLVGEAEPLRALGINLTDAAVRTRAVEMGLAATTKEVEQAAMTQARLSLIMEQSSNAQGDFARTSDGLANQQRILKATWGDTLATIGGVFLPLLTGALEKITPFITGTVVPAFESIAEKTGAFMGALQRGVDPLTAFSTLLLRLGVPPEVVATIKEVGLSIQTFVAQAIAAGAPIVAWIAQNVSLQDVLVALGIAVASVVVPALGAVVVAAAPVIATGLLLIAAVAAIRTAWETDFLGMRTFVETTLTALSLFWQAHGEEVIATVQSFLSGAQEALTSYIALWRGIFEAFGLAAEGDWRGFGERLRAVWDTGWQALSELTQTGVEKVKAFFTSVDWGSVGSAVIDGIASGITSGISALQDAAKRAAQSALDAAKGFLGINSPSKAFMQVGLNSALGFAEGLSYDTPIKNAARSMGATAVSTTQAVTNNRFDLQVTVQNPQQAQEILDGYAFRRAWAS